MLLLLSQFCLCSQKTEYLNQYGKVIKYSTGSIIEYPDFSIRFTGTKHVKPDVYPRGWLVYEFEVLPQNGVTWMRISWSSGTGCIAPTYFKVNRKEFVLELDSSVAEPDHEKSNLEENEMIIWKKKVYLRRIR
jgi:hypothetical protein